MGRKLVLVADDSELIRQVLSDAFGCAGYEVATASDGVEALQLASERRPDVIVADILMPVMDGWALCEEVRRDGNLRDVPFVFLTTERDVPKRIKGLESGADDYVCKPFSKEELLARVEAVTRRAARSHGGARGSRPQTPQQPRLAGHTDHMPMPDLLQLLSQNNETGTLHIRGASVARVYFEEGQIVNTEAQGLKGEKALFRVMAWPEARFEFEPGAPAREVEPALNGSTPSVLMEGFAHLDELRDLAERLPPRERRVRISSDKVPDPEALDLTTTQRLMLHTAGNRGATVAQLIDTVPDRDLDAYKALSELLESGLIEEIAEETAPS